MSKKYMYSMSVDVLLQCYEDAVKLARSRGKKPGEDFGKELFEIAKQKGLIKDIECIGTTNKDADLLTGDLREKGLKVLNINEEIRKKKKKKEKEDGSV